MENLPKAPKCSKKSEAILFSYHSVSSVHSVPMARPWAIFRTIPYHPNIPYPWQSHGLLPVTFRIVRTIPYPWQSHGLFSVTFRIIRTIPYPWQSHGLFSVPFRIILTFCTHGKAMGYFPYHSVSSLHSVPMAKPWAIALLFRTMRTPKSGVRRTSALKSPPSAI
jgi:hypothetical protein